MASLRVQLCPNTVVPFGVSARCAARRGREAQDEPEDDGEERGCLEENADPPVRKRRRFAPMKVVRRSRGRHVA
jgi:hypothetical protein